MEIEPQNFVFVENQEQWDKVTDILCLEWDKDEVYKKEDLEYICIDDVTVCCDKAYIESMDCDVVPYNLWRSTKLEHPLIKCNFKGKKLIEEIVSDRFNFIARIILDNDNIKAEIKLEEITKITNESKSIIDNIELI